MKCVNFQQKSREQVRCVNSVMWLSRTRGTWDSVACTHLEAAQFDLYRVRKCSVSHDNMHRNTFAHGDCCVPLLRGVQLQELLCVAPPPRPPEGEKKTTQPTLLESAAAFCRGDAGCGSTHSANVPSGFPPCRCGACLPPPLATAKADKRFLKRR